MTGEKPQGLFIVFSSLRSSILSIPLSVSYFSLDFTDLYFKNPQGGLTNIEVAKNPAINYINKPPLNAASYPGFQVTSNTIISFF